MGAIEEPGLEIFGKRSDAGPQEKWTTERVLSVSRLPLHTGALHAARARRHRGESG